jgi:hypothetical protein
MITPSQLQRILTTNDKDNWPLEWIKFTFQIPPEEVSGTVILMYIFSEIHKQLSQTRTQDLLLYVGCVNGYYTSGCYTQFGVGIVFSCKASLITQPQGVHFHMSKPCSIDKHPHHSPCLPYHKHTHVGHLTCITRNLSYVCERKICTSTLVIDLHYFFSPK